MDQTNSSQSQVFAPKNRWFCGQVKARMTSGIWKRKSKKARRPRHFCRFSGLFGLQAVSLDGGKMQEPIEELVTRRVVSPGFHSPHGLSMIFEWFVFTVHFYFPNFGMIWDANGRTSASADHVRSASASDYETRRCLEMYLLMVIPHVIPKCICLIC